MQEHNIPQSCFISKSNRHPTDISKIYNRKECNFKNDFRASNTSCVQRECLNFQEVLAAACCCWAAHPHDASVIKLLGQCTTSSFGINMTGNIWRLGVLSAAGTEGPLVEIQNAAHLQTALHIWTCLMCNALTGLTLCHKKRVMFYGTHDIKLNSNSLPVRAHHGSMSVDYHCWWRQLE